VNFEKFGEDGQVVLGYDFFLGDFKVGGFTSEVKDMQLLDDFIPAKIRRA
jgi:activating signal cointegrator 1